MEHLSCNDFIGGDLGCCSSCHEDEELGYASMMDYDDIYPGKLQVNAHVCCGISNSFALGDAKMSRDEWAKILWTRRARLRKLLERPSPSAPPAAP